MLPLGLKASMMQLPNRRHIYGASMVESNMPPPPPWFPDNRQRLLVIHGDHMETLLSNRAISSDYDH